MDPHHHHHHHHPPGPPPPARGPPPPPHVVHPPPPPHVVHHPPPPPVNVYPPPPVVHHVVHHHEDIFAGKPTLKIYCKAAGTNFSLSVRDGRVVLAHSNPSDPHQQWVKDEKYSTRVKDEEGLPSFALINKATRQAMKHAARAEHPVQLVPYDPNVLDETILWTQKDLGDGYFVIRKVNNIRLNVDAFKDAKNHWSVHDGSTIGLWEWTKADNQRWKIEPH